MSHKMGGIFGGSSSSSDSSSNPFVSGSCSTNQSTGIFGQQPAGGSTSAFGTSASGRNLYSVQMFVTNEQRNIQDPN